MFSDRFGYPFAHISTMSKRAGELTRKGNPKVKRHNGVKIRSTLIPDSDEESPSSTNVDCMRWVKTRVTTSGNAGSVKTSNIPLVDAPDVVDDPPTEADAPCAGDTLLEDTVPATQVTRRQRKKQNDSVSLLVYFHPLILLMNVQTKMESWLDLRPIVLDEIISLDGPGDMRTDLCGLCLNRKMTPLYRCLECSYGLLFCGECAVASHQALPLHRLEVRLFHMHMHPPHHAHIIQSAGRMGFLIGCP